MPASASPAARSWTRVRTTPASTSEPTGSASSSRGSSSGAIRARWARPASTSSRAPAGRAERPAQTSATETTRLGSSRSWANNSTVQSPSVGNPGAMSGPSSRSSIGSRTRRHSRVRPPVGRPLRTQATRVASSARRRSGSSDGDRQGSVATRERTQASGTVRRPGRGGARSPTWGARRARTSRSTSSASWEASAAWDSAVSSSRSARSTGRSPAASRGHHQDRALPSASTVRPGTTWASSTNPVAREARMAARSASARSAVAATGATPASVIDTQSERVEVEELEGIEEETVLGQHLRVGGEHHEVEWGRQVPLAETDAGYRNMHVDPRVQR